MFNGYVENATYPKRIRMSSKTGPKHDWKMDEATLLKLEVAFSIDCTVVEACAYSGISPDTFYRWMKKHPELSDKFEALRLNPILKARQTVVSALGEPEHAKWYLTRKKKDEFSEKTEVDQNITFEPITFVVDSEDDDES